MKTTLQYIAKDRTVVISWVVLALLIIVVSVIFGFRIHPSDLNVPVHYSSFGVRHFYNDSWYYLLLFLSLGIMILVLHTLLMIKLFQQKNIHIAKLFIWLSIIVVIVQFFTGSAIIGVADLL